MPEPGDPEEAARSTEPAAAPDAIGGGESSDLLTPRERPVLVSVAGILLIDLGIVELLLAALVILAYALSGVILWGPTAALGVASIVLGVRIRRGHNRVMGLLVSVVTVVLSPLALGITFLGLGISLAALVVLIGLFRHGAWFRAGYSPERELEEMLLANQPPTIVRTYRGRQQSDAIATFQNEASILASQGYMPTSQSWGAGQWRPSDFLAALFLAIFLVGIVLFIYLLVIKPEGTLTVTYVRRAPEPVPTDDAARVGQRESAEPQRS